MPKIRYPRISRRDTSYYTIECRAIGTVSRNLVGRALIVIFILVFLLGNLRAGLIVASEIPFSYKELKALQPQRWKR